MAAGHVSGNSYSIQFFYDFIVSVCIHVVITRAIIQKDASTRESKDLLAVHVIYRSSALNFI